MGSMSEPLPFAVLHVDDVHGAAETTAEAAVPAHQLRQHPVERGALRDRVPVRTVSAREVIVVAQCRTHADSHGLLADVEVERRGNAALQEEVVASLLKPADEQHTPIHIAQRRHVVARRF